MEIVYSIDGKICFLSAPWWHKTTQQIHVFTQLKHHSSYAHSRTDVVVMVAVTWGIRVNLGWERYLRGSTRTYI